MGYYKSGKKFNRAELNTSELIVDRVNIKQAQQRTELRSTRNSDKRNLVDGYSSLHYKTRAHICLILYSFNYLIIKTFFFQISRKHEILYLSKKTRVYVFVLLSLRLWDRSVPPRGLRNFSHKNLIKNYLLSKNSFSRVSVEERCYCLM